MNGEKVSQFACFTIPSLPFSLFPFPPNEWKQQGRFADDNVLRSCFFEEDREGRGGRGKMKKMNEHQFSLFTKIGREEGKTERGR